MIWHTAHDLYFPGDIVSPGRWGRIVLATGPVHPAYAREQWLEQVRAKVAPFAPSRLAVAFGHAERAAALGYMDPGERLYEVAALGTLVKLDMLWITWVRESLDADDAPKAYRQAALYWQGHSTRDHMATAQPHWEFLALDGWRVVALLDDAEAASL